MKKFGFGIREWKKFGSGIRDGKISDPGSETNIPDPQHCNKMLPKFKIFRGGLKAYFD
jgi:hypothetical protein